MHEYEGHFNAQSLNTQLNITTFQDIQTQFLKIAKSDIIKANVEYLVGASFAANGTSTEMIAWFNGQPYHTAPLALNMLHNAIVKAMIDKDHSIQLYNHPLKNSQEQSTGSGSDAIAFLVFWISFVSAIYISSYVKVNFTYKFRCSFVVLNFPALSLTIQ